MKKFENKAMLSALERANSILLCTHVSPDGDAVGSLLCVGMALKKQGKRVVMACHDAVPEKYAFLQGADLVVPPTKLKNERFDLSLALDAGDLGRIGDCREAFLQAPVTAQIDHHATNPRYAAINEVDGTAAATGCIVLRLLHALGIALTKEMAECLYTAISTDTGNFCFANADEEAFSAAEELLRAKIDLADLARRIHLMREKEHVQLLGRALSTLHFFENGRASGMKLTQEDYQAFRARPEHSDKIVNYGLYLKGVYMTYLADERETGITKFSLRALPPCDVSEIAAAFDGGGHALAAGCKIEKPMAEACAVMEKAMQEQIEAVL